MTQTAQGFTPEQIDMLKQLLNEDQIKDRAAGGGKRLKYIKGDMAIDTANRIFGFGQWGYKVVSRGHMIIDDPKKGKIEMYTADVELSVLGSAFTFPGGGVGIVNDPYTVEMHEKAYKEAETDAMKRALRHYGDQFGLSLYNEDDPIEGRDGTIKPVKAAVVQNNQSQQVRRVVESQAPRPQINAPQQQPKVVESNVAQPSKPAEKRNPTGPLPEAPKEPQQLNAIPSASQLRKQAGEMGLDWEKGVLPGAFAPEIAKKKISLDKLVTVGDELPPGYCKRIAEWLDSQSKHETAA